MKTYFFIASYLFLLLLISCGESSEPIDLDDAKDYYPLEIGNYWHYKIDSISYIDFQKDTSISYSREVVVDEYEQNGHQVYLIEKHVGDSLEGQFLYHKTFTVSVQENQIVKTFDNLPFIKLVNPLLEGPINSWAGNGLFSTDSVFLEIGSKNLRLYENWEYYYEVLDTSELIETILYDEVLTVNQVDFQTFIDFHRANESYAKDVGLIKKSLAILQNGQDTTNIEDANYGIVVEKTLLEYGK